MNQHAPIPESGTARKSSPTSQTLVRGMELLEAVGGGFKTLPELAHAIGLPRSTTHRLATALVDFRFLNLTPRLGYSLGSRVLAFGYLASRQMSLPRIAHDFLMTLAAETGDTVHLGVLDNNSVLYLDKIPGSRRIQVSSRIGERQPLRSTGLGKALLLDEKPPALLHIFNRESATGANYPFPALEWLDTMRDYKARGFTLDLNENEDDIRCVAAPIRNAGNAIIGAISVTGAAHYMDDGRIEDMAAKVKRTAETVSAEFGWNPKNTG